MNYFPWRKNEHAALVAVVNDVAYFRMYGCVKRIPFDGRYEEDGYDTDGGFVIEVK